MSLTRFVKTPRISKAFDEFTTKARTPKEFKGRPILVHDSEGPNGLAGAAFDYLARIEIARVFRDSNIIIHQREWISESISKRIWDRYDDDSEGTLYVEQSYFWRPQLDEAHAAAHKYIAGNGCARCLSTQTQYMAYADLLYRTRSAFDGYVDASGRVAQELTALREQFDPQRLFEPKERIILNPDFALGEKVGGADGDIIIDDRLIEFKTTKRLSLTKSYLIQLIGYVVLHDLGGTKIENGIDRKPLNHVGVYFYRHNTLVEISIDELFPNRGYEKFKSVFEDEMNLQEAQRLQRMKAIEERLADKKRSVEVHA